MNVLMIALDAAGRVEVHDAEVLVVAPAFNSRLRHWLSDDDGACRRAEERANACVDRLERVARMPAAASATQIPCRRSPMRSRSSPPTRS